MDLTLYRVVGGQKRVALGDLADGTEYFTAEKDDSGVVTLTPVQIRGGRTAAPAVAQQESAADPEDTAPDAPWAP